MGVSKARGNPVIRKSTDGGINWTQPKHTGIGLLRTGDLFHCAPVPVLVHGGRIWRAMEQCNSSEDGKTWDRKFASFMMSASVDANLLAESSWIASNYTYPDYTWFNRKFGGWLEGNAVATPSGEIVNILRVQQPNYPEKAAIVRISANGRWPTFDPAKDFVDFPGGGKKFTIRHDTPSKKYWTLTNFVPKEFEGPNAASRRNTLALASSADLRTWEVKRTVIQHKDVKSHGYQYADWLFDGDDLIAAVRTASDEPDGTPAHSAHDANYLTFHRVAGFRK